MKNLVFTRKDDKHYEVRIFDEGDEHSWVKYGELVLNESENWELWTGTGFSSEGSGLEGFSDDCTEYSNDLDETYDALALDLSDTLEIF